MNCVQCGAELRPGAHFCNVCGADQRQLADAAAASDAPEAEDEGAARLKRPARVPRPTLGPALEDAETESDAAARLKSQRRGAARCRAGAIDTPDA